MDRLPRRQFLHATASALASAAWLSGRAYAQDSGAEKPAPEPVPQGDRRPTEETSRFQLSLSQRSLRRALEANELKHLAFAETARREFNMDAIDYASRFFKAHMADADYLSQMNRRAADQGVRQVLLIVDGEGPLATTATGERQSAVDRHRRWIDTAAALGCRAVVVRIVGEGDAKEQAVHAVTSLSALTEHGTENKISVLVANDHGLATNAKWLLGVLKEVDSPRCAAFPVIAAPAEAGAQSKAQVGKDLTDLMKVAKGVGTATRHLDLIKGDPQNELVSKMAVVVDAGYRGYVSLEYRGDKLDEFEGIRATQKLLDRIRQTSARGTG